MTADSVSYGPINAYKYTIYNISEYKSVFKWDGAFVGQGAYLNGTGGRI